MDHQPVFRTGVAWFNLQVHFSKLAFREKISKDQKAKKCSYGHKNQAEAKKQGQRNPDGDEDGSGNHHDGLNHHLSCGALRSFLKGFERARGARKDNEFCFELGVNCPSDVDSCLDIVVNVEMMPAIRPWFRTCFELKREFVLTAL